MRKGRLSEMNDGTSCGEIIMSLQDFEIWEDPEYSEDENEEWREEELQ